MSLFFFFTAALGGVGIMGFVGVEGVLLLPPDTPLNGLEEERN
jgi:hypothetical protein